MTRADTKNKPSSSLAFLHLGNEFMSLQIEQLNQTTMPDIESIKANFKIVRLAEGDVRCRADSLVEFEELILRNVEMYPAIGKWYREKVLPGIRHSERVAFVGYLDEKPAVSALVKKGAAAKFCHLRISDDLQSTHLGEVFFSLMALEIRDLAKNVFFTLPESLWNDKGQFFQSFGFSSAEVAENQYRLFDRELECRATFSMVWQAVLEKIPKLSDAYSFGGFSPDNQLLLSIRPEFAERILKRTKTVEIRRRFSRRWLGHRINIYASAPVMSLVGEARIAGIVVSKPEEIWSRFENQIGCTRMEFDHYTQGAEELYAMELDEVRAYRDRFPLAQISSLLRENLVPPQSYFTLEKNKPWAKAISIAAYLHGCFKSKLSLAIDGKYKMISKPPMGLVESSPMQTELRLL
jgi:predicted transcriptional regulator